MAECQRQLGNTREMVENIKRADNLVAGYVKNPMKNPLDRPTISAGSNSSHKGNEEETEEEFMERFNRLMTNSNVTEQELAFNDKIKGRATRLNSTKSLT